jgi:hypothetical protein
MSDTGYRRPPAQLRQLVSEGAGYAAIARLDDVPVHVVRYRARRSGAVVGRPKGRAPNRAVLEMGLAQVDLTLKALAKAWGCQAGTVARVAKLHGLPTDEAGRRALREARS